MPRILYSYGRVPWFDAAWYVVFDQCCEGFTLKSCNYDNEMIKMISLEMFIVKIVEIWKNEWAMQLHKNSISASESPSVSIVLHVTVFGSNGFIFYDSHYWNLTEV